MLDITRQFTVRLTRDLRARVEAEATDRGCSPSELVRRALEQYFLGQKLLTQSELRHHRISEYSQVALDAIILENHADIRDSIVAETDRRMVRYHGSR